MASSERYKIAFECSGGAQLPPGDISVKVQWSWSFGSQNSRFDWGMNEYAPGTYYEFFKVPHSGGTIGDHGTVGDSSSYDIPDRPLIVDDQGGNQGTVTFSAPGVQTLVLTVTTAIQGP